MSRPKHPNKEIEQLIRDLEASGWVVWRGRKHYKGRCPCREHTVNIHITPSNRYYPRNRRRAIQRETCWEGAGE